MSPHFTLTETRRIADEALLRARQAEGGEGINQLTGDVLAGPGVGSQPATVVAARNGEYLFGSGGTMTWSASSVMLLTQAPTTAATATNSTWRPQTSTDANATNGSAIVQLAAPSGTGVEASFQVHRGPDPLAIIGVDDIGQTDLWLGKGMLGTTHIYAALITNPTPVSGPPYTYLNAPPLGAIGLLTQDDYLMMYLTPLVIYMGDGAAASASIYFDIQTQPPDPSNPAIHFGVTSLSSRVLIDPQTADVATIPLEIVGQSAFATATVNLVGGDVKLEPGAGANVNGTPGNVFVALGLPSGTGTEAGLVVSRAGTQIGRIGLDALGQHNLWLNSSTLNAEAAIITDGSTYTYFNTPPSAAIALFQGDANAILYGNSNGIVLLGSNVATFGGGTGVIGVTNASVTPGSNPVGGGTLYSVAGAGTWLGSGGTHTTFGPADLEGFKGTSGNGHCPSCGTDFGTEFYNPKYGGITFCFKCMLDEMGDRPWIVRRKAA
jgi:hypothetical protein